MKNNNTLIKTAAIAGGSLALGTAGLVLYVNKLAKDLKGFNLDLNVCNTDLCALCGESKHCDIKNKDCK